MPVPVRTVWRFLMSPDGVRAWLGMAPGFRLRSGRHHRLADGTQGVVRVFRPQSHLRLTWQPAGWPRPAVIQGRVTPMKTGTQVSFHQEHLPRPPQRSQPLRHFHAALGRIERALAG